MASTANRVMKNTGYLYMKMGITMFISLYTTRLILNSLGASDFGIFNLVGGAIGMLGFLNNAMATATQRYMSYSEGQGDKERQRYIFNASILLHTAIALFMGFMLTGAGYFFFHGVLNIPEARIPAAQVVYGSLTVSVMFSIMTVPYDAAMNAHENMRYYAVVGVIESLLKLSVAFACVYTTADKLIVYGILMACIPLITLSIMRIYCHKKYEECILAPRRYWNPKTLKELTAFAGWNFLGSFSSMVGSYGSPLVVNHFFGTLLNAALGIAGQLTGMLLVFSGNMLKALNPVIIKTEGKGDHTKMLEYSYIGCKLSFFLFAIFCLPCIIEAPFVLKLWLKNVPEWAVLFVRFQLIKTLIEQIFITLNTALNATGKIGGANIASFIFNLLPLALIYIAFSYGVSPHWYYPIIIVVGVIMLYSVRLYFCYKYCGLNIPYFLFHVAIPCALQMFIPTLIGSIIITYVPMGITRLVLSSFIVVLTLIVLSYITLEKHEKAFIGNMLISLKSKKLYKH